MKKRKNQQTTELTMEIDGLKLSKVLSERTGTKHASLVIVGGMDVGDSILLPTRGSFTMGRDPSCDYMVKDDGISRIHAEIDIDKKGNYILRDLNSTNGVFIEGDRVTTHLLEEGDRVLLGRRTVLKFVLQDMFEQKYQKQMYESSVKDALTSIYNRKHFDETIISEMSFASRHDTSVSLLMLDLDNFKQINDTHGHPAGDEVLVGIVRAVEQTLREEDFFARYGGEEFVIIARNIGTVGSLALAERIRKIVEDLAINILGIEKISVTVSIGVVTLTKKAQTTAENLLKFADTNLYKAKESGRNKVIATAIA